MSIPIRIHSIEIIVGIVVIIDLLIDLGNRKGQRFIKGIEIRIVRVVRQNKLWKVISKWGAFEVRVAR